MNLEVVDGLMSKDQEIKKLKAQLIRTVQNEIEDNPPPAEKYRETLAK